jgi:GT2 family glycosyltransferase
MIDSADRLRNLDLFLRFFETFFENYEIVLVEQGLASQVKELIKDRFGVRHFFISSGGCHYKTRNLNRAAALATRDLIMMLDVDAFIPPEGIKESIELLRSGSDVVAPYNGVMVDIKKETIDKGVDFLKLVPALIFFDRQFDLNLSKGNFTDFVPIYGGSKYEATGGVVFYRREPFFLAGGWNENFVSYGFEDMEFMHRIVKLGYKLDRVPTVNCYHFEHSRGPDSYYNNFYRSNEQEYERVSAMTREQLRLYVDNGFRNLRLDSRLDLAMVNTSEIFSMRTQRPTKVDLSCVATVLVLQDNSLNRRPDLDAVLDYFEAQFDNYLVVIVEVGDRKFKYLRSKKNIQYLWLPHGYTLDEALQWAVSRVSRRFFDTWKCRAQNDIAPLMAKYSSLLKGTSPSDLFQSQQRL